MGTIFEHCTPRDSVFQSNYVEDVISIDKLDSSALNGETFFEETYLTDGMKRLFEGAFRRFLGEDTTPIIRLKQSMGGGKSHNMVALALLARNPSLRRKVLGHQFETFTVPVRVITFYGRESDQCFWHTIAKQVGNHSFQERYPSTLAPGKSAWTELLQGQPTLILLDEMPPYLAYAETQPAGLHTMADVITQALNNLFTAVAEDLDHTFLVISDLNAAYENGSRLIEKSFGTLNKELERHCMDIEPVQSTSDDIYRILRTKLFQHLPDPEDLTGIASEYRSEFIRAKRANLIRTNGETIYQEIFSSYPFHPDLKKLFARFQCNQNFQQTRGILRLMRSVLRDIYLNHKNEEIKLISACHIDLNNTEVFHRISAVMPALDIAVSTDIAHKGTAIAEQKSQELQSNIPVYLARTFYISSLSEAVDAPVGLTREQAFEQVIYPGFVLQDLEKSLNALRDNAWYLHKSVDNCYLFKPIQNVTAQINNKASLYNNQHVLGLIKETLKKKLEHKSVHSVFQASLIYPGLDEIQSTISRDKVLLVVYYPHRPGLTPELLEYWKGCTYKNRIMFLGAEKDTMDSMYTQAKRMKACDAVEEELRSNPDKLQPNDMRLSQVASLREKARNSFMAAAREYLSRIYYPEGEGLAFCDVSFDFQKDDFNFEAALLDSMKRNGKFTQFQISSSGHDFHMQDQAHHFARRVQEQLFTQETMKWDDVLQRAAETPSWIWYANPDAQLEELKTYMLLNSLWSDRGSGYISTQKPTAYCSCSITATPQQDRSVFLRPHLKNGDIIHYMENGTATPATPLTTEEEGLLTRAVWVSFLCEDSSGQHESASPCVWENTVRVMVLERTDPETNQPVIELSSNADGVVIKYSLDSSNLSDAGLIYNAPIPVPDTQVTLRAEAFPADEAQELHFKSAGVIEYVIGKAPPAGTQRPVHHNRKVICRGMSSGSSCCIGRDTVSSFRTLSLLEKYNASLKPQIRISPRASSDSFLNVQTGGENTPFLSPDTVKDLITTLHEMVYGEGDMDLEVSACEVQFPSGSDFEDYAEEACLSTDDFDFFQQ